MPSRLRSRFIPMALDTSLKIALQASDGCPTTGGTNRYDVITGCGGRQPSDSTLDNP